MLNLVNGLSTLEGSQKLPLTDAQVDGSSEMHRLRLHWHSMTECPLWDLNGLDFCPQMPWVLILNGTVLEHFDDFVLVLRHI